MNREKIIAIAAELMCERGPNVPMAEIASVAGVGVATLYRTWPDRAALMHSLELRAYGQLIATLERIRHSGETGADAIRTYLYECLRLGPQLVLPLRWAPPLVDQAAVAARLELDTVLEQFLEDGRITGSVNADVNASDVMMFGALVTQPVPVGADFPVVAQRQVELFVRGLRAPSDQPLPGPMVTRQDIEDVFRSAAKD
ncbi:hypothetical protein BI330_05470 [Mycobacterium sp. CBMA 623]|nr:hypothetical protein [Mycobacteroides sp. CBMA 326]